MADAAIKGAKGVSHSYHKINGPLGLLTRKVQENCQEGQASAHKILAPFWISAAFRGKEAKRAKICGGTLTVIWHPNFLSRPSFYAN
jgi:hypothetical protein